MTLEPSANALLHMLTHRPQDVGDTLLNRFCLLSSIKKWAGGSREREKISESASMSALVLSEKLWASRLGVMRTGIRIYSTWSPTLDNSVLTEKICFWVELEVTSDTIKIKKMRKSELQPALKYCY
eukprot:snap_masked-scaffold_6-processed-gene-1.19-mRNA-1 protein AED:1.00 eAED:1.00 QI:0/0/0/0/1/1/2/0/125